MLSTTSIEQLSDRDLLDVTQRVAGDGRQLTAQLLALLGEVETRQLYLGQGCSSPFAYCTEVLHLSEHAAYHRIEAARAARQFPVILELVATGALTLTSVALLRPHLTRENHVRLLEAARHKTKDEVKYQIACLAPRPDQRSLIRKVPTSKQTLPAPALRDGEHPSPETRDVALDDAPKSSPITAPPHPTIAPLSPDRYLLKVTVSADTHDKLRRAQDLMRHTIPNGDPAAILDRALTLLVEQLESAKTAKVARPRQVRELRSAHRQHSRHIPASGRRAVWARDEGRCAFVGARGRCKEKGRLEYHHLIPFADGGSTSSENLALRCRAHNAYEATLWSPG